MRRLRFKTVATKRDGTPGLIQVQVQDEMLWPRWRTLIETNSIADCVTYAHKLMAEEINRLVDEMVEDVISS